MVDWRILCGIHHNIRSAHLKRVAQTKGVTDFMQKGRVILGAHGRILVVGIWSKPDVPGDLRHVWKICFTENGILDGLTCVTELQIGLRRWGAIPDRIDLNKVYIRDGAIPIQCFHDDVFERLADGGKILPLQIEGISALIIVCLGGRKAIGDFRQVVITGIHDRPFRALQQSIDIWISCVGDLC